MSRASVAALAACIALSGTAALAEPSIDVGTFTLLPNTANQIISIPVTGGDAVTGFNLRAQIGDGSGPEVEPSFQSIDFGAGTIWAAHSTTVEPTTGTPSVEQYSVVLNTLGDSVSASGTVVNLTISTLGVSPGSYPLLFSGSQIGSPSVFIGNQGVDIPASISNGTINVSSTPEPCAFSIVALSGAGLLMRRRRTA
jgi:hypothetical protein